MSKTDNRGGQMASRGLRYDETTHRWVPVQPAMPAPAAPDARDAARAKQPVPEPEGKE